MSKEVRGEKTNKIRNLCDRYPAAFAFVVSLLLCIVIEMLSRHSVSAAFVFIFREPLRFLINFFIIYFTMSLGLFVKRRYFVFTIAGTVWLILGIADFVVLTYKATPISAIDIILLKSMFSIIFVYLNIYEIILIAVLAVLLIAGLVLLFIKTKKYPVKIWPRILVLVISGIIILFSLIFSGKIIQRDGKTSLKEMYMKNGFTYCFTASIFDRGIDEPDEYSRDAVDDILGDIGGEPGDAANKDIKPNIVLVQLESFFDVNYITDVNFSENPVPVFTELKEKYASGFLNVPTVGAGTANTEFEILTGMCVDYFGTGEYPYKTILQTKSCETICYDLKPYGFSSHAIHNHNGTFYDRNKIFAQLGFDTFSSMEYMQNITYNPIGWANDDVLTDEILKALDSTEERDFVFTITVQGHGKYSDDAEVQEVINVTGLGESISGGAFEYYVSQLHETDRFIGDLTEALRKRSEPTVLVLYGDHLPNFDIDASDLKNGDLFQTEYVIWDNFGLRAQSVPVLEAYQLTSYIFDVLNIEGGTLTKFHEEFKESRDYGRMLEILEYDMLYGEEYSYNESGSYEPTDMQMGTLPVRISGVDYHDGYIVVKGENFTKWSSICVDGDPLDTIYNYKRLIYAKYDEPSENADISVAQINDDGVTLSVSNSVIYK